MVQRCRNADRLYTFFITQLDSFPTPLGPLHPSLVFWGVRIPEQAFFLFFFLPFHPPAYFEGFGTAWITGTTKCASTLPSM